MTQLSTYKHYGKTVTSVAEFVGMSREICICHQGCQFFKPDEKENCEISEMAYQLSKISGIVTVLTCLKFRKQKDTW